LGVKLMPDFEACIDMSLTMVIRGARCEAHAEQIARKLAEQVAVANEGLRGYYYGTEHVAEFSINNMGTEVPVEISTLED
jgi:hypothetical protein